LKAITQEESMMIERRVRRLLALSLVAFVAACTGDADTGADDEGSGENTILPAEDQTGGVGDMGTGTGTTGPGTETQPEVIATDTMSE
jgi:hypothetical protein